MTNEGDVAATVHWHGLRLENRYDGVPHDTQAPIEIGETFTYKVQFPDAGFYWYHPHIREDFGLEMGLYGTIIVEPTDASYWPEVDRQMTITLDDLLVEDGHIAAFNKAGPNFTAMGRFGNIMLINGEASFAGEATPGEVVRLYIVNTANTRIFNFALRGAARMKLVGSDSGRYERETFVDEVLLAPSERAVVDVLFDAPGEVHLEHRTPEHTYDLGAFAVAGDRVSGAATSFDNYALIPELTAEHRSIRARPRTGSGQSARVLLTDAASLRRRDSDLVRLSDASRGHVHGDGNLPEVWDDTDSVAVPSAADLLRLSHAPGGDVLRAGDLSRVWDEARGRRAGRAGVVRLPDAPGGDVPSRDVSRVRHEARRRRVQPRSHPRIARRLRARWA